MNQLIKTNLDNLNIYKKEDLEFLSMKAFSYFDSNLEMNYNFNIQRIPHCSGILFNQDSIPFKDIDIFNKWRKKNNNWEYTKHFFEDFLRKGTKIDIEKLLQELSPFITSGNRENIQSTYEKYLRSIKNNNQDPITLEDIATYGNLFLITLISSQEKSLDNTMNLLYKYCCKI